MEQILIQSNTNYRMIADNFLRAICETNHIENYYATISVPLLSVIESAMSEGQDLVLIYDYCPLGIQFQIKSRPQLFSSIKSDASSELGMLLNLLVDDSKISDSGDTLTLEFAIQGIDVSMAESRIASVKKFYSPTPTAVAQINLV